MTKYEPKTDDVDRVGLLQWMEQSPQCSRYSKDSIKYILHDLTHAEACLKERDAEIERLKNPEWRDMAFAPLDGSAIWAWCGDADWGDGLCMPRCTREGKWMTDAKYPTEVFPKYWQPINYPKPPLAALKETDHAN